MGQRALLNLKKKVFRVSKKTVKGVKGAKGSIGKALKAGANRASKAMKYYCKCTKSYYKSQYNLRSIGKNFASTGAASFANSSWMKSNYRRFVRWLAK